MSDDGLPKIEEYSLDYWRAVAKEYGIKIPTRANKAQIYALVIARMRLHAAFLHNRALNGRTE